MAGETSKGLKKPWSNRAVMSCDRCKGRKTKCIRQDPGGSCNSCRSVNQTCSTNMAKRRQKPFYFVSEEEYRLLQKLCKKSFPGEDLSLENLRNLTSQPNNEAPPTAHPGPEERVAVTDEAGHLAAASDEPLEVSDVPLPEIVGLHKDLGCLMEDAQGEYRYMGAESGAGFNVAVRDWVLKTKSHSINKEVIPTWVKARLPGAKPQPTSESFLLDLSTLPSQDVLLACAARYFEEVHSMYWLYSSEDFYSRLEVTYSNTTPQHTDSWLCSLHSIVALTATCVPISNGNPDENLAHRSLEKAKMLTSKVCDEADLDSIRALMLLAFALSAHGSMNSSYLHLGMASRIAFSLGLHLDKHPSGVVAKEHGRRIWWSLFLFDQDLALHSGKPSFSEPSRISPWYPPLPSEQIVNPGLHTPFEHLKYCVSLAHLVQSIRHNLYIGPIQEGCKLSQSNFEEAMKSLKRWRASIPQHLDLTSSSLVAPCHHRPIALLQLRYLAAVMLVTRPFLLCSLLRGGELNGTPKLRYFEGLAKTCVSATEAAIDVLEIMLGQGTLSSLILFDFLFALQVTQLGLTASGLFGSEAHNIHPQRCLNVLKKIGESGYPKQLLPETLYQLQKVGLRDDALLDPAVGALPHNEIAVDSGRHLEGNPSNQAVSNVPTISHDTMDDLNFLDVNVDEDFMEQLMEISWTCSPNQNTLELLQGNFVEQQ